MDVKVPVWLRNTVFVVGVISTILMAVELTGTVRGIFDRFHIDYYLESTDGVIQEMNLGQTSSAALEAA